MTSPTSRSPEASRSGRNGFTLLELLLAVAIMALVLGLGLPRVGAVRDSYLAAEDARAVAGLLRTARMDAVAQRSSVTVSVSVADEGELLLRGRPSAGWCEPEASDGFATSIGRVGHEEPAVVRRTRVAGRLIIDPADEGIVFHADGTSSGGGLEFRADGSDRPFRYHVDRSTGRVVMQREDAP